MNKKVLQLTTFLDIGGLERMIYLLCSGLQKRGWSPHVFVYHQATGTLSGVFADKKIPVEFYDKKNGFSLRAVLEILKYAKKNEIDLIHSHDLGALIYACFVKLFSFGRIKIIHTQHSFQHLKYSWRARIYEQIFPHFAQRLVVVSEDLKSTYVQFGINEKNVSIVQNGVDFSQPRNRISKQDLISKIALPAGLAKKRWFLYLARITPVKGQLHILQIWKNIPEDIRANAALLFVGPTVDSNYEAELKKSAPLNVLFLGPTMTPELWFEAADFCVSSSEFEGSSLGGLEAAAAGCALVLSDIPGHQIFSGLADFFRLNHPEDAVPLFSRLIQNGPSTNEGKELVRARLAAENGTEKMVARYESMYEQLDF